MIEVTQDTHSYLAHNTLLSLSLSPYQFVNVGHTNIDKHFDVFYIITHTHTHTREGEHSSNTGEMQIGSSISCFLASAVVVIIYLCNNCNNNN